MLRLVCFGALFAALFVGCGPGAPRGLIRGADQGMLFRISIDAESLPPRALDLVTWRIAVTDQKTGQPVQGGEGRIYAMNKAGHNPWDGLAAAPEVGVYTGRLRFVNAEQWAMGLQFRRDSLSPFAQIDWTQEVRVPSPLGKGEAP